ncbi:proton-conducting transporter membrane subunit [Lysobacter sp. LF1]|uniref:Proton-conducting transporter membrane subunit n=1 Tax=Lysobacter stagni TaxID=3045172 RepID=A0ABT6XI61_9GAMM|nr:proton-conducting transporter membrane subunit [Lysobacter sp. LF1]MDI9239846.1 proton-conducting transporter membrane subunit [Lysobacter sp. LF1]
MSTPHSVLLVLLVLVPFAAVLVGLVLGGRNAERLVLATVAIGLLLALAVAAALMRSHEALVYVLGGWQPPLGVALRADGLSAVMLVAVAVVMAGIAVYARASFGTKTGEGERRSALTFWLLLLSIWGALNLVFVAGDVFTLYVALELLTFAAVPLVCLDGTGDTLRAALRYLLFALVGSMLYLLGAFLLYGGYGALDIPVLAMRVKPEPIAWSAAALMTAGLLAKTALFPLHLWLPPAHAGAPAAASAVLSALVVKGSWFLLLRLWIDVFPDVVTLAAAQLLAALGATAIVLGNLTALRQVRLKLLIAYSTVAQIGYLFLMFPLVAGLRSSPIDASTAVTGGMLQTISHATAKAAMFMAAGLVYTTLGHDRLTELRGVGRALPMTTVAFALAGASLIGLPPSGGFLAKWLLLSASFASTQWWWACVMLVGGLLTSVYVFTFVVRALAPAEAGWTPKSRVPAYQQHAVLALALCSFVLGAAAWLPGDLMRIGAPTPAGAAR